MKLLDNIEVIVKDHARDVDEKKKNNERNYHFNNPVKTVSNIDYD